MSELILLIAPRWLAAEKAERQIAECRAQHPAATLILLAAKPLAGTGEFISLPARGPLAMLKFLPRLRRQRFDAVVILADDDRVEAGYLESKVWAFAARSAVRRINNGRALNWREEFGDKLPLAVSALLLRLLTARRPAKNQGGLSRQSLEAFVYLQQLHRHGGRGKLLVLGRGGQWFMVAARGHGWDAQWTDGEKPLGEPEENFAFVTLFDVTDRLALAGMLTDAQMQLAPGGFCLLRTDALDMAGLTALAGRCQLRVVQSGESLFRTGAVELWLTPVDVAVGGGT